MKELTIQEKAKRYDEAIEIANEINNKHKAQPFDVMLKVFPELKESEDERIRKALIDYFDDANKADENPLQSYGVHTDKAIAWLEKQYEKLQGKSAQEAINEKKVDNQNCIKPTNKVEPKFKIKEGKWYICISQFCNCIEGRVYKATSDSRIMDDFGTEYDIHSDAYKYFRLWTIKDAKPGDVLADENDIVIFKENNYNPKDKSGCMVVYCSCNNFYEIGGINPTFYKPATKEQCEQLEKAMADAGYTFDFEKKELKKIEQSPAWSEEDEDVINHLLAICAGAKRYRQFAGCLQEDITKYQTWLKSLKDRCTWKPSDEQINGIECAIKTLHYQLNVGDGRLDSLYYDLKKLKE